MLDGMLKAMLLHGGYLTAATVANYSWHSFRIYLACALRAAGASAGEIQALCRWVTEQSLAIYARMNETDYVHWLRRAAVADVNSVRATSLAAVCPPTDDVDVIHGLLELNFEGE